MKIDKHELVTALKFVESTMNDSDITGGNKIFTFNGTDVCAMNDELHLRYPIKTDFKTTVPAVPVVKLLDKVNTDEIVLTATDKEFKIKAGKAQAAFPIEDTPEHIDEVKTPDKWQKLPDDFVQAVQLTQFTSGKSGTISLTLISGLLPVQQAELPSSTSTLRKPRMKWLAGLMQHHLSLMPYRLHEVGIFTSNTTGR